MIRCKLCGTGRLHWEETEHGWRLFNNRSGKIHACHRPGHRPAVGSYRPHPDDPCQVTR